MSPKKAAQKATPRSASRTLRSPAPDHAFTAEEQEAIRERARELKTTARAATRTRAHGAAAAAGTADAEGEVLAKIAGMKEPDRTMATRLHRLVAAIAPELSPRTWYGMPAYAKAGKVVCYFQAAQKFKTRYATVGFSDAARLDEGAMWPTAFALTEWTSAVEAQLEALVRRAIR